MADPGNGGPVPGNSPYVSGPDRGRAHAKRDITKDDQLMEPRPANHNAGDSEIVSSYIAEELTKQYSGDEFPVLGPNRKSHFEIIAEPCSRRSI